MSFLKFLIGLFCLFPNLSFAESPPNIVVILVDDMGYGDLKSFNPESKIETPNLNQLASEGMKFTDAHAPGPLCHLSRYGLLTGRYPFREKVGQWSKRPIIGKHQMTIASLLKANGYATHMVGKWHLGFNEQGYDQPMTGGPVDCGFDSFFGIRASTDIPPYFYVRDREAVAAPTQDIDANRSPGWSPIQGAFWRKGKIAPNLKLKDVLPRFTEEAVKQIVKGAKSPDPLFLYLALPAPHTPWLPDEQYQGKSKADMYGDFVSMVDGAIGKVVEELGRHDKYQNTLLLFSSDNGPVWYPQDVERLGHDSAGGLRGMKADAWEAGHRMPLIAHWPGVIKSHSESDQLVCFTDLLATFAELLEVKLPLGAGPDSVSFLPVLQGKKSVDLRTRLAMASGNGTMTIRSGNWKLIDGLGSGGFSKPGRIRPKPGQPRGQLYNLKSDLKETTNLYRDRPELVARLSAELEAEKNKEKSAAIESTQTLIKQAPPNIVLVMTDDQGWGQTSYNGHPILKTPNLDAMAANGLRFNRFYAAGPVCSPTRASILTGRTHRRTGVELYGFALRSQEKTIVQLLQKKGYATGHFGKWHLNGLKGPGIPIFADDTHHPGEFGFETWLSVSNFFDRDPIMGRQGELEEFQGDSSEIVVDEALKFIRRCAEEKKPSLTVIWFGTPHGPFRASDEDSAQFSELNERSRNHYGELVAMDRSIGNLRSTLKNLGIANNTVVWFTSDNGGLPNIEKGTTGGLRGFKGSLYEGGIRVPGIVEWPANIKPGRVTEFPAVSLDIAPTLAAITGCDIGQLVQPQDGMSLTPLFSNEIAQRKQKIPFAFRNGYAVVDNNLKMIRKKNGKTGKWSRELYDLSQDPKEKKNLYSKSSAEARMLDRWLDGLVSSVKNSVAGGDYPEGRVAEGNPKPTKWNEIKKFERYFDDWKRRPEYKGFLKNWKK